VAMEEWARASVADLEERTQVRAVPGSLAPTGGRRRRRNQPATAASPIGTIVRDSNPASRSSGTRPVVQGKGLRALTWAFIASAVLVITLGAVATVVLVRASNNDIPVVSDISATVSGSVVEFTWSDPGVDASDTYQIITGDGASSIQRSTDFVMDAASADRACITVTVNREGRTGARSVEKCVEVAQ